MLGVWDLSFGWSYFWGLGFPSAKPKVMQQGTLCGDYPKTLDTTTNSRGRSVVPVPILTQVRWRWMMRKQFQTKTVSKRFSNEVFGFVVNSSWKMSSPWQVVNSAAIARIHNMLLGECDRFMIPCFAAIALLHNMWSYGNMVYWCCSVAIAHWWSKMESWETVSQYKAPSIWGQTSCYATHKRKTSSFPCIGVDGLVV